MYNRSLKITCTLICAGLLVLGAGCTGKTTYLDPVSNESPQSSTEQSSAASETTSTAESSTETQQSSVQSSETDSGQSSEAQSSAEQSSAQSSTGESYDAQQSSGAEQSSTPPKAPEIPSTIDSVPQNDKDLINTKNVSEATKDMKSDSSIDSPEFIESMKEILGGGTGRFVVSVISPAEEEGYDFNTTDLQNSDGATYIVSSFEDDYASYELVFLKKDGVTYELDDLEKVYFLVENDDINTEPYRIVSSLVTRFTKLSEKGTAKYNNADVDYEKYEGSGETLFIYYSGSTILGGEIYDTSSGNLKSVVYADLAKKIDSSHTSLPSDFKSGN